MWCCLVFLGYLWAFPYTLLGCVLLVILCAFGARVHFHTGVLEVYGGTFFKCLARVLQAMGGVCPDAFTLGHVVIARDAQCLQETRAHERVHVKQYMQWGVFFLPAYYVASAWAWYQGKDKYRDNWFEVQAYGRAVKNKKPSQK